MERELAITVNDLFLTLGEEVLPTLLLDNPSENNISNDELKQLQECLVGECTSVLTTFLEDSYAHKFRSRSDFVKCIERQASLNVSMGPRYRKHQLS